MRRDRYGDVIDPEPATVIPITRTTHRTNEPDVELAGRLVSAARARAYRAAIAAGDHAAASVLKPTTNPRRRP